MTNTPQQAAPVGQPSTSQSSVSVSYAATTSRYFGIIQIVGGILAIVIQAILIGIVSTAGYSGAGIWCGILVSE